VVGRTLCERCGGGLVLHDFLQCLHAAHYQLCICILRTLPATLSYNSPPNLPLPP
jgi:hypothetical protein